MKIRILEQKYNLQKSTNEQTHHNFTEYYRNWARDFILPYFFVGFFSFNYLAFVVETMIPVTKNKYLTIQPLLIKNSATSNWRNICRLQKPNQ